MFESFGVKDEGLIFSSLIRTGPLLSWNKKLTHAWFCSMPRKTRFTDDAISRPKPSSKKTWWWPKALWSTPWGERWISSLPCKRETAIGLAVTAGSCSFCLAWYTRPHACVWSCFPVASLSNELSHVLTTDICYACHWITRWCCIGGTSPWDTPLHLQPSGMAKFTSPDCVRTLGVQMGDPYVHLQSLLVQNFVLFF